MKELRQLNPEVGSKFGDFAVCLVSEPIGKYQDSWKPVPENSQIVIQKKQIEVTDFKP
jgi:hypothetical protein